MELVKLSNETAKKLETQSLSSFRIKATDKVPQNVYITSIAGTKKFSRKNISAWIGPAKSKKTFAMTMLASSMVSGMNLYDTFSSIGENKVLWIDTEQSPADAQKVVKRIKKLAGSETNLILYGLRPLDPKQRVELIQKSLKIHKPDVLVIDGIRDLIWNINDPVESTAVVSMVMKWSYDFDIHIAVVIHQTRDGKSRGHIGTEIENKSETVIRVQRDETDINISSIKEVMGRGKGFNDFDFYITEEGLPKIKELTFEDIGGMMTTPDDAPF